MSLLISVTAAWSQGVYAYALWFVQILILVYFVHDVKQRGPDFEDRLYNISTRTPPDKYVN